MITIDSITSETAIHDCSTLSSDGYMNYTAGSTATSIDYSIDNWGKTAYKNLVKELWNCAESNSYDNWKTCGLTDASIDTKTFYRAITDYTTGQTTENDWYYRWNCGTPTVVRRSAAARLKEIFQKRQAPLIITSHKSMTPTSDLRETRARGTLRRVLGDDKFKSFIKKGFISVRAKSGLVYQIFPGHGVTSVYRDGEMTERLCVVLKGNFPATDSIIMRYLLILNDERDFRKHAIKHQIIQKKVVEPVSEKTLPEIWRGLKVA